MEIAANAGAESMNISVYHTPAVNVLKIKVARVRWPPNTHSIKKN